MSFQRNGRVIGENPGIFTQGSCYLPWIAQTYGLRLDEGYATGCREESGSKEMIVNKQCKARNEKKVSL